MTIEFRGVASGDGCISIRDDGHGMDLDALLGRWMEPAGTSKVARVTPGSRSEVDGCSARRESVGSQRTSSPGLELVSRCAGDAREIRAVFDWDDFDTDARMLSDVSNRWEVRPATEVSLQGTVLRMTGPRTEWTERMFRRLCTRLARLLSPFTQLDSFAIRIESDEFPQYSGELRSDILERSRTASRPCSTASRPLR